MLLQSYVRFAATGCAEKLLEAAAVLEEKLMGVSFVAVSGKCTHGPRAVPSLYNDRMLGAQRKRRRTTSERPRLLASRGGAERERNGHEGRIRSATVPLTLRAKQV